MKRLALFLMASLTLSAAYGQDATALARTARELGQLERPGVVPKLLPLLAHDRSEVRREAANALGQSLEAVPRDPRTPAVPELDTVTRALIERLTVEDDPFVRGTIAEALGRLPYRDAGRVRETEEAIQRYLPDLQAAGPQPLHHGSLTGVAKGLEALIRANRAIWQPDATTVARLEAVATADLHRLDESFIAIRRLAWLAVNAAAAADAVLIEQGYADPDSQVRRLALAALAGAKAPLEDARRILGRALADPSLHVRYEAVRAYGRLLQPADCAPLIAATRDSNTHVVLGAIDALGNRCPAGPDPTMVLTAFADQASDADAESGSAPVQSWRRAAHAIVALAQVNADAARPRVATLARHALWQVRAYAARAATTLGDAALLERLAGDASDNVRFEALQGLRRVRAHAADPIFIAALERPDYQLVLAAAEALEGSPDAKTAVPALLRAFARLTLERRDTSRDPRMALLARVRELGSPEYASVLQLCLRDFDPAVAEACAAILQQWSGQPQIARPTPVPKEPMSGTLPARARVVMRGGRSFDLEFYTDDAPESVSRVAALVRRKYYDGLTFHRVLPNFIIQGGSPGANEYAGDGPFMRDELGLKSNVRGTVGISTRGRHTGDAQVYINLLDNPRLDHEYTVFAGVTSGMDVVDAILEGDVIERIEIR